MQRKSISNKGNFPVARTALEDIRDDVKEEPVSPLNDDSEICITGDDKTCVQSNKRRTAHTVAEQKRRDAIKKGYDDLQQIVPTCLGEDSSVSPKLSKAVVLQKTIEYLRSILDEKDQQQQEIDTLKKEVLALKIMKANYEQIASSTYTPGMGSTSNAITEEAKFNLFKRIMDAQFVTFNNAAHVTSFSALSASIFKWLEEECKPQKLQEIVVESLQNTKINGI
ncbi:max-like protein X [Xenia sp. Carnegie-2017]|uniref:max-like protein X n=1 Tax=Xenia sp. Carnegie-2017 TaxID=2897299 RepID=UPI001F04A221|nr:max-like protein X [Xenia sp. Carnegie-2017]